MTDKTNTVIEQSIIENDSWIEQTDVQGKLAAVESENQVWNDNHIQFPRLIAEIMATQDLDLECLAESMDLTVDDVNELFDRASEEWGSIKAKKGI